MSAPVAGTGWLLALDTSTASIVVAAGSLDGRVLAAEVFEGRYRHSQELLPAVVRVIQRSGLSPADLAGLVVGTGPGAFTGLRVGIATAKTLAHELGRPIVGIASSSALLAAVDGLASDGATIPGAAPGGATVLWLPAGPRDRIAVVAGAEPVVVPGADPGSAGLAGPAGSPGSPGSPGSLEVAVDLVGRAPEAALELGRAAVVGLPAALLRLGAARLAAGETDDPAQLVPRYASPPRGAAAGDPEGAVAWSRDPR